MSYQTQGASNRNIYDCCDYAQQLQQSVDPLQYYLYFGAQENCSKCIDKKAWYRQDKEVVDVESELWNITRPLSRCDQFKYNPNCKTGPDCISTFADTPKILSPSLCPIVYNNIPIQTSPGYKVPNSNICAGKNDFREADNINTYESYKKANADILGNSNQPQNAYMFLNSCSNKPLYKGEMEKLSPMMAGNDFNMSQIDGIPLASQMHQVNMQSMPPSGIQAPMWSDLKNNYGGHHVNVQASQSMYETQPTNKMLTKDETMNEYPNPENQVI
jgi:hypothetical protein